MFEQRLEDRSAVRIRVQGKEQQTMIEFIFAAEGGGAKHHTWYWYVGRDYRYRIYYSSTIIKTTQVLNRTGHSSKAIGLQAHGGGST